ncbi:hypothetical protein DF3PB_1350001 [uncultured Defluviicoccus sp.]|uniref:Uncharacterized protein n=1 Tax=metagenome TaxID=256318 RepID=A0A380TB48_9ZZZZ|nr:hypothetical protein DF3PB_1350001 [uncultured Defluviicoccus sp.]
MPAGALVQPAGLFAQRWRPAGDRRSTDCRPPAAQAMKKQEASTKHYERLGRILWVAEASVPDRHRSGSERGKKWT